MLKFATPDSNHRLSVQPGERQLFRILGERNRDFSAQVMRATFAPTVPDNGRSQVEIQRAASHADASTTKLHDRRGCNLAKPASFFANYCPLRLLLLLPLYALR